jgi:hypothetical protein
MDTSQTIVGTVLIGDLLMRNVVTKEDILHALLNDRPTKVVFRKNDGTERTMTCTRQRYRIPREQLPQPVAEGIRPPIENPNIVRAFDLKKQEWRSFKMNSIIEIGSDWEWLED